jgi:hypothetical protein
MAVYRYCFSLSVESTVDCSYYTIFGFKKYECENAARENYARNLCVEIMSTVMTEHCRKNTSNVSC